MGIRLVTFTRGYKSVQFAEILLGRVEKEKEGHKLKEGVQKGQMHCTKLLNLASRRKSPCKRLQSWTLEEENVTKRVRRLPGKAWHVR